MIFILMSCVYYFTHQALSPGDYADGCLLLCNDTDSTCTPGRSAPETCDQLFSQGNYEVELAPDSGLPSAGGGKTNWLATVSWNDNQDTLFWAQIIISALMWIVIYVFTCVRFSALKYMSVAVLLPASLSFSTLLVKTLKRENAWELCLQALSPDFRPMIGGAFWADLGQCIFNGCLLLIGILVTLSTHQRIGKRFCAFMVVARITCLQVMAYVIIFR